MFYIQWTIILASTVIILISTTIGEKRNLEELYRKIFYEATGLKYLNDKVFDAAYRVYILTSREFPKQAYRSEIKLHKQISDAIAGGEYIRFDLLNYLDKLMEFLEKNNFSEEISCEKFALEAGLDVDSCKKFFDFLAIKGIVGDSRGGKIKINYREFLDFIDYTLNSLRNKVSRFEIFVKKAESALGVEAKVSGDISNFDEVIREIEDVLDKIFEEKFGIIGGSFISKLRKLRGMIGEKLFLEILECRRVYRLSRDASYSVKNEEISQCTKVLEKLKRLVK